MQSSLFMKDCENIRNFLMDYLDGVVPLGEAMMFRLHVLLCTRCRRYMNRYSESAELARNIMNDPPPPELINLTMEFVRKQSSEDVPGIINHTA
ncbi:MAG: zf-HC2 domain-containing protein [SAR324 cluster bacterium]|nr:zf-HC2 domain-containing protein [SAR324 cluster bacterium]